MTNKVVVQKECPVRLSQIYPLRAYQKFGLKRANLGLEKALFTLKDFAVMFCWIEFLNSHFDCGKLREGRKFA